jgi:rare lipoprotein A
MILRVGAALCGAWMLFAFVPVKAQSGIASVYGTESGKTASGEAARPTGLTAAHRTLPLGSRVRVTNKNNGRSVVVRINDRGPFIRGRSIDLSAGAARVIGMTGAGVARVRMHVI